MKYRSLILRGNRALASTLLDKQIVSSEDIEKANEHLLEFMKKERYEDANLLKILTFKLDALDETKLLNQIAIEEKLSYVNLGTYDKAALSSTMVEYDLCRATWSIPFNNRENIHYVATANYLSEPIRKHWQETLRGYILWYLCSIETIENSLEALKAYR